MAVSPPPALIGVDALGCVGISANELATYPEDSFDNMKLIADRHDLPFPYLCDESQVVARAYDAQCTPDFFGLDADGRIQYRGRLDEGRTYPPPPGAKRELLDAMRIIAEVGQ
jgi:hypothetical protein